MLSTLSCCNICMYIYIYIYIYIDNNNNNDDNNDNDNNRSDRLRESTPSFPTKNLPAKICLTQAFQEIPYGHDNSIP